MSSLAKILSDIVGAAFEAEGLPVALGGVRVSDRPDLAQFQCNGAMAAAKVAKANPREIAGRILARIEGHEALESVEIAGPGFINFNLKNSFITKYLADYGQKELMGFERSSGGRQVLVDYGGMNVAKAMHVGHLRSLVIGDCLKKLYAFAGFEALGDIHLGDWGLQMGQIISEFELRNPEWVYFDAGFEGPYPEEAPFAYADLQAIYPEASRGCKEDKARLELARKATADLQDGRAGYRALWQHFIDLSVADIKENIALLGVEFEIWKGESSVHDLIPEIEADLRAKGVLVESDGALVVPVEEESDTHDIPPLMFKKSDGAATYGTTDVATIYDRMQTYPDIAALVYEVDVRQRLHYTQFFRTAQKAGYVNGVELVFVGHGTVNGPDGKPYKTRDGAAMPFADMIAAVVRKAEERLSEANLAADMGAEEREKIARLVAAAALKFNELSNQPHMDYVFDLDRMTAFEGKTGPYMLYQVVRIKSLLRKAEDLGIAIGASVQVSDEERGLCLLLAEFSDHFALAMENHTPHVLCEYAYRVAQEFSRFYGRCHILSEEDEGVRASRLGVCALVARQLEGVLGLLGIDVPERM